ncbi:hypothetical protein PpBr36_07862 [Pyricularia pennisetigena]|uniref:hypothetical protein n=1 Tax=Pyricularia pennisetigena TaxID=1578925 RepID=UPI001151757A|nr:hypothetical protein PpBr36_07862 [Pyricularia pennisetigena]TLS26055.1 hypothetical protein PpBr36_07862 [Pyricularia pennisetigena]
MRVKNCIAWVLMLSPAFGKPVPAPMPPVDPSGGNNGGGGGGGGGSTGTTPFQGAALGASAVLTLATFCLNWLRTGKTNEQGNWEKGFEADCTNLEKAVTEIETYESQLSKTKTGKDDIDIVSDWVFQTRNEIRQLRNSVTGNRMQKADSTSHQTTALRKGCENLEAIKTRVNQRMAEVGARLDKARSKAQGGTTRSVGTQTSDGRRGSLGSQNPVMSGALGGLQGGGSSPPSSPATSSPGRGRASASDKSSPSLSRSGSQSGRQGSISTASTDSRLGGDLVPTSARPELPLRGGSSTGVDLTQQQQLQKTSTSRSTGSSGKSAKADAAGSQKSGGGNGGSPKKGKIGDPSKNSRRSIIAKRRLPLYFEV